MEAMPRWLDFHMQNALIRHDVWRGTETPDEQSYRRRYQREKH